MIGIQVCIVLSLNCVRWGCVDESQVGVGMQQGAVVYGIQKGLASKGGQV